MQYQLLAKSKNANTSLNPDCGALVSMTSFKKNDAFSYEIRVLPAILYILR